MTLTLPPTASTRAFVAQQQLPASIRVRLVRVLLTSGEVEVLLTTLCDARAYPASEFKTVYGERWGEETYFDRYKNIFEVERFSGTSEQVIRQDFLGIVFLASLESVLAKSAQQTLTQQDAERATKLPAQVNRAVSYVTLVDEAVALLLDEQCHPEDVLTRLHQLFQKTPTRHRAGRH